MRQQPCARSPPQGLGFPCARHPMQDGSKRFRPSLLVGPFLDSFGVAPFHNGCKNLFLLLVGGWCQPRLVQSLQPRPGRVQPKRFRSSWPPGVAVAFVGRRDLCQLPRLLVLGRGLAGRSRTAAALGCWCLSAVLSSRAQDSGRSGPTVSSIGTLLRQSGVARSSCQPSWCRLPCPASWLRRRLLPRHRPANTLRQPRNWKWCGRHWPTRCGGECSPSMHSGDCGALPTFCRSTYGMVSFGDRIWACPMPECVAHATWRRHPPKSTGGDRCSAGGACWSLLMSALGSGHAVGYGTKGAARQTK